MTIEHAAENKRGRGDGRVDRIADQVDEIIGTQALRARDSDRMDEHESVELLGRLPQRSERRIVKVLAD